MALIYGAESKNTTQSRISLLVRVCHSHTATCGDIETFEFATFTNSRNEANIIREYVDVIRGRNSNSNFELENEVENRMSSTKSQRRTLRGR